MAQPGKETRFHAVSPREALDALDGTKAGLSAEAAARRLSEHGPNRLPEPPERSPFLRFLAHFHNVLIYVLLAAAGVTALLQHWIDTGVILAVVVVNAVIGYVQEGRAEQAMAAIRGMLAPRSAVLRDGRRQSVDAADLVPGDIVLIEAGDRVPADLRLVEARGLKAEEAILTGESVPVDKGTAPVAQEASLGDRTSMLFSGTLIAAGTGRGLVTGTGAHTQIGRISGMLAGVETLTTPLVAQMDRFARWLTVFILIVAAALLAWGTFVSHMAFSELFMAVQDGIVAQARRAGEFHQHLVFVGMRVGLAPAHRALGRVAIAADRIDMLGRGQGGHRHLVAGERAGLVRADHRDRAQRFNRGQTAGDGPAQRHRPPPASH